MKHLPREMSHSGSRPANHHCPAPDGLTDPPPSRLVPDLRWLVSYDAASVDRYVEEVDAERARIRAQTEEAKARRDQANIAARRSAARQAELAKRMQDAQRDLEALRLAHHDRLAAVEAEADRTAAQILDQARQDVAAIRASARAIAARRDDR